MEGLLSVGLLAIFLGGMGLALLGGEASTVKSGDHGRAAFLAEEQMEVLRHLRGTNLSALTPGEYGLQYQGGTWSLTTAPVQRGGYSTRVSINALGDGWIGARSTVQWNFGKNRSGSIVLHTYLTDWRATKTVGNWTAMTQAGTLTLSGTPDLRDIVAEGSYAYLAGTQASGGPGLAIVNVSNPAAPIRVSSSFNLGAGAYALALSGDRLYIATDNPSAEVQVYDIASPSTLQTSNLINSYDLPGSGRARSIAVYGSTVYVGTTESPSEDELYALRMSETGPMTLLDSMDIVGTVNDISLHEGFAYLATSKDAGEFLVVDTFDPTALVYADNTGVDLANVQDGTLIAAFGTSAILGRAQGSTIEELILYDIASAPVPVPPPGPWTLELNGSAKAFASIPGMSTAFVGSDASSAQLRVINLQTFAAGGSPITKTVNVGSAVLGLMYDWEHDRLLAITASSLLLYKPG